MNSNAGVGGVGDDGSGAMIPNAVTSISLSSSTSSSSSSSPRVGSYDLLRTIGHGNFSVCKLAEHRVTNEKFAIKCIPKKNLDPYNMTRVYREIEIMKSLDHPNIIKLHQVNIIEREDAIFSISLYLCFICLFTSNTIKSDFTL